MEIESVRARLFLVAHHGLFRSGLGSCGEFTEFGQSLQSRSFGVAGAAKAGAGNQGGGSEGDQSKDADHVVVFF